MPTYDYACQGCGHAFAEYQTMSAARLATCPKCKKKKLRRLIGAGSGIVFKGSGFYITDYARKGKAGGEGGGDSAKTGGGDTAKPAAAGAKPASTDAAKPAAKGEGGKAGPGKGSGAKSEGGKSGGSPGKAP